jgi:subtilisin family serine protease
MLGDSGWGYEIKESTLAEGTRLLALQAMAEGRKQVPIVVASAPGGIGETETLIRNSGGQVLRSIPEIGYMHAVVPLAEVWRMIQVPFITDIAIAGTTMFAGDLRVLQPPSMADPNAAISSKVNEQEKALGAIWDQTRSSAAFRSNLPLLTASILRKNSDFDPNRDMQVDRWRRKHPTADGRGVTIAIFDGVADLEHPALQWALDELGRRVPKIAGVIDPVDHSNPNPAGYFDSVNDDGEVNFSLPRDSKQTSCPAPQSSGDKVGIWTLHWYAEQKTFCVTWDEQRKTVQLALPKAIFSAGSKSISEFNHRTSYLRFPIREIFPEDNSNRQVTLFCLQDSETKQVFLHLGQDAHTTMAATAAGGTSVMGTVHGGGAPGARILYIEPGGYRLSEMIEGIWKAASRQDVDLISITTGIDSYPNDPQPVLPLFLDRISMASSKPVFVAAGNEGNSLEQNARGGKVIVSVGAYEPARMMRTFGFAGHDSSDHMAGYSASGPNTDGSWSTTLVAPAPGITGWECGDMRPHPPSARVVGDHFKVPDCCASGGGTSVTTPRTAGAVALLLGEAKLRNIAFSPLALRQALVDSALPLSGTPSSWQGAGRLQIATAWAALMEEKTRGTFVLHSSTSDIVPFYPQFWRGPKQGTAIYMTRGIHPQQITTAVLRIDSERVLSGCNASMRRQNSDLVIRSAQSTNSGHTLRLQIEATPQKPGLLSTTVELHCSGYQYPVDRIPITLAVTPSPDSLKVGVPFHVSLHPDSQSFALFELPLETTLTELHTETKGGPALFNVSLGSSPLPVFSSSGYLSLSTALQGVQDAALLSDQPDLVAVRIEDVATVNSEPGTKSISLRLHALSSDNIQKQIQSGDLSRRHIAEYSLASTTAKNWTTAKFEIPIGLSAITLTSKLGTCADIYLFHLDNARSSFWNRLGCSGVGVSTITVPHPLSGSWIIFSTYPIGSAGYIDAYDSVSTNVKPIQAGGPGSFRRFGDFCAGLLCAQTWPLQNPIWRDIPVVIGESR